VYIAELDDLVQSLKPIHDHYRATAYPKELKDDTCSETSANDSYIETSLININAAYSQSGNLGLGCSNQYEGEFITAFN
jgi:hypothetical protein